jgi:uncharacterized protein
VPADTTPTLFDAITSGDRTTVQSMLATDARVATAVDTNGLSPLLIALYHHQPAIAADLLQAVPPEMLSVHEAAAAGVVGRLQQMLQNDDASAANAWAPDGFSPLALAAFFGRPEAVELLLEYGAQVKAVSRHPSGVTALHAALAGPQPDIARVLIAAGADVNARQRGGFTPLHTAAQNGSLELSQLLLDHGADPNAATDDGRTPADLARAAGHTHLAERLVRT